MIPPFSNVFILVVCFAPVVLADDFKTVEGKEYKNVTVSRVEPDGLVLSSKSGISKVYFTELPKEIQERFHYDAAKGNTYSAEQTANLEALYKQRQESERQRVEEREKYWSEHPAPQPQQESSTVSALRGSALDRPAYGQSTTAEFLVSQYATNQINADRLYTGRTLTMSGTIKSIDRSERGEIAVELLVPYRWGGKAWFTRCIFNDSRGLEQYQVGNPIPLIGTVAGLRGYTLTIKDCHLHQ